MNKYFPKRSKKEKLFLKIQEPKRR